MAREELRRALDLVTAANQTAGPDLDTAHTICQHHEGQTAFDWLHAVIHRIEGDDSNAAYWYKRCGYARHPGSVAEELTVLRRTLGVD